MPKSNASKSIVSYAVRQYGTGWGIFAIDTERVATLLVGGFASEGLAEANFRKTISGSASGQKFMPDVHEVMMGS